jgi:hypothetical protein
MISIASLITKCLGASMTSTKLPPGPMHMRTRITRLYSSNSKKDVSSLPPSIPDPSEFPEWAHDSRDFFSFEILHESEKSQARVGRIHTPHGTIDTPGYVAVATNAALKGVDFRDADDAGQQLIFAVSFEKQRLMNLFRESHLSKLLNNA